jgi:hypothetical protein
MTMGRFSVTVGALVTALVAFAGAAAAQDAAPTISVTANGSGCPAGSYSSFVVPDGSGFELDFADGTPAPFAATVDSTHPIARKNCQATVTVTPPAGWQFSLGAVFVGGSASLADGATALHKTLYYWQGKSATVTTQSDLTGSNGGWGVVQQVDPDAFGWSKCGQPSVFNVNSTLQVRQAQAEAGTTSVVTEQSEFVYDFVWQPCTP